MVGLRYGLYVVLVIGYMSVGYWYIVVAHQDVDNTKMASIPMLDFNIKIAQESPTALEWVNNLPKQKWTQAYDGFE
ncbi:hypothetical protein L195_g050075, partial [Trifolium pratense]